MYRKSSPPLRDPNVEDRPEEKSIFTSNWISDSNTSENNSISPGQRYKGTMDERLQDPTLYLNLLLSSVDSPSTENKKWQDWLDEESRMFGPVDCRTGGRIPKDMDP